MTTKQEGVWEAYTPLLSPLEVMKPFLDPFDVPEYSETSQICPIPLDLPESNPDSLEGDGTPLAANSPAFHNPSLPEHVPAVVWRAAGTFPRLADNALGLDFPQFQMHAGEPSALVTSTPQVESLRAPSNHQDIRSGEHPNWKCYALRGHATPQPHVTANDGLVAGCLQDTCLRSAMSNTPGSEVREHKTVYLLA